MHFLNTCVELAKAIPPIFRERVLEIQQIAKQVEDALENVNTAKHELFNLYSTLSKEEVDERSQKIRNDYKKLRELCAQKYQLTSDMELLMDRVNHKVKKDLQDFRYELELENPGCTYEFEKRFVEEDDRNSFNLRRGRSNNRRGSSVQRIYSRLDGSGPSTSRASATPKVEKHRSVGRPSTKSLKKLAVNTGSRNWLSVNSQNDHFQFETPSASSSFRASPVSNDHSPTPSTSRLSTPAYTPGPVSPAIRQSFSSGYNQPSTSNFSRYQQGYSSLGQANGNGPLNAVAMTAQSNSSFQINSPMSGSISPQPIDFDPVSTAMPSFAGVNESRHGRPRKLTTRVKQMLNAQRTHRPGISTSFGNTGQYMSPLSTQSYSAANSLLNKTKSRPGVRPRGRPKSRPVIVDEEPMDAFADDDFGEEVEIEDDRDTDYTEAEEENGDDNRPWCFCKTKSYGEMVACESGRCPIEWFHFQCVNLTEPPRGVWICPVCRAREQNRAA
ncbi:hypothetical protein M3Y94_01130100 [Aphelenchoides besseyi]|nr:hypothetical protein M3Y94_01130100 [Aphelenchoides besseyi]